MAETSDAKHVFTVPKGVQYCCVCNSYRGKTIDERKILLHRFPGDSKLRNVWIQRVRTVMKPSFRVTAYSRLCSEHFLGKGGPKAPYITLPSLFPNKKFKQTAMYDSYEDSLALNDAALRFMETCSKATYCPGDNSQQLEPNEASTQVEGPLASTLNMDMIEDTEKPCNIMCMHDYCKDRRTSGQAAGIDVGVQTSVCMKRMRTFLVFDELSEDENKLKSQVGCRKMLRYSDEFFLVMMRLRLGFLLEDLADRFNISTSTCSSIFTRWVQFLFVNLTPLIHWPSRQQIDQMMPSSFRALFPKCRVVIDCTELVTNKSQSLITQTLTYSHYKSGMTWKGLVGITPNGILSFVSDLWLGSISDQQITKLTQLLDLLEPGDAIMADKGFDIAKFTTPRQIDLIIPPKRSMQRRMTAAEIILTRRIARLRIHVERYMGVIKRFRILDHGLAETSQPNEIWKVCNAVTMLYSPLNP